MTVLYHAQQSPTTKVCSRCHQEKPLTDFSRDTHKAIGYRSVCKNCAKLERDKKHQSKPPRPIIQRPFQWFKICRICQIEKPFDQFDELAMVCKECRKMQRRNQAHQRDLSTISVPVGLQKCDTCSRELPFTQFYRNRYRTGGYSSQCKECNDKCKRQWDADHADHVRLRKQQYYHENMQGYNKIYYYAHREQLIARSCRYYEETKERFRPAKKAWQQANLIKCAESNDRRRAHKQETTARRISYKHILEQYGYWCYICEQPIDPDAKGNAALSFDHVLPLAGKGERKGTHTEDNIKPAHRVCNSRKHTRLIEEMTPYQRRGVK